MSVHRYSIIAVGLIILIEIVAFGDGKDQLAAQVAQPPANYHRHKLADLTSSPGEPQKARKAKPGRQQDKGQDKSQVGRSAQPSHAMAPETGAVLRPDLPASNLQDSVCLTIEAAGRAHDLPPEFFVRVIWQESRFQPDTVGPRRRNGESAQGIAQFMPSTAAERGLLDPFDPVQALPKAAQFLRELKDQFGNLGLAAAAYNAGPARVRAWLAGARTLSVETRNYVVAVTGVPADEWAKAAIRKPAVKTSPNCGELMALLQQPASPQESSLSSHDEPGESQNTQLAENDLVTAPLGSVRGDPAISHKEAPSSRGDTAKQPPSPQESSLPSHDEPEESQNTQLAENDLATAPLGPVREDPTISHKEAPSSRGDTAKQPPSPQESSLPSHDEPGESQNTHLAKNDLATAPLAPVRGDFATPHQKAPSSRGDAAKQPPSPQGPSLPSQDAPGEPHNTQLAKNDLVTAPSAPVRGDVATPHAPSWRDDTAKQPPSPQEPSLPSHDAPAQSQNTQLAKNDLVTGPAPPSRGDTSLFVEKLTERVKLVAESPWGIQLSAGFSRERVLAAYAIIANRYAGTLAGRDVSILSSVFRNRGTGAFYQVRVGTDTLESADSLCAEIRRAGGACMVLRNRS